MNGHIYAMIKGAGLYKKKACLKEYNTVIKYNVTIKYSLSINLTLNFALQSPSTTSLLPSSAKANLPSHLFKSRLYLRLTSRAR